MRYIAFQRHRVIRQSSDTVVEVHDNVRYGIDLSLHALSVSLLRLWPSRYDLFQFKLMGEPVPSTWGSSVHVSRLVVLIVRLCRVLKTMINIEGTLPNSTIM